MAKLNTSARESSNLLFAKAEEVLRSCLEELPFLSISKPPKRNLREGCEPDIMLAVRARGVTTIFLGEVKANGQPRYAREATNQLRLTLGSIRNAYGVFIAPFVSEASAEICREAGIGYLDFAGNCRLSFGTVFVERKGNRNPSALKRDLRSLYSPKGERVLGVLLNAPAKPWRIIELAEKARVSVGQVANVKELLRDREWIEESREKGFWLRKPKDLLEEWSQTYKFERSKTDELYSLLDIPTLERRLAETCASENLSYALTGFSAAARLAPAVRYQRVTAYVNAIPASLLSVLQAKEVTSGANLTLAIPYDEGILMGRGEVEVFAVVSPIQLYLDLKSLKGRGEEDAAAVMDRIIEKQWR